MPAKPMSLLEQTQTMLGNFVSSGVSLRQLARESDGEVEYDWLKRFAAGDIGDPSVNRIQRLHDALKRLKQSA